MATYSITTKNIPKVGHPIVHAGLAPRIPRALQTVHSHHHSHNKNMHQKPRQLNTIMMKRIKPTYPIMDKPASHRDKLRSISMPTQATVLPFLKGTICRLVTDYKAPMQIMHDQHRWMSTNFNLSLQEEDGQERPDVEQELDLVGLQKNIQNLRTKTSVFIIVSL